MAGKLKYTEKDEAQIVELYKARRVEGADNPTILAEIEKEVGRARASIRSKLVSLKAYQTDPKPDPRPKDEGPTKKDIQSDLASFGVSLDGSDNASKAFLSGVVSFLVENGVERKAPVADAEAE